MRLAVTVTVVTAVLWEVGGQNCPPHNNRDTRPQPCNWASSTSSNRDIFLDWLISGCTIGGSTRCGGGERQDHVEYEGYDGWYNNLARPSLGAVDTPLLRLLPPAYSDGVYEPVNRSTNPLRISSELMTGRSGKYSKGGRTAFLVFFGQQVVEEILDAQGAGCPPEYFNIKVNEDHEYHRYSPRLKELPLLRTRYDQTTGFSPNNPRQQLNEITPYMDGGLVYGTAKGWADVLRTFSNGTLASDGKLAWHDELGRGFPAQNTQRLPMANPPPPTNHSEYVQRGSTARVNRFFKLGNPRGNENPFLLTFGILWYRWHNVIAEYLNRKNPSWSDERVFNEARKWVIATYQSVVFYDWLPKYMRTSLPDYEGYKPTTDPQVSHVFQSAAMRFGHTLVTSGVHLRDRSQAGCGRNSFTLVGSSQRHGTSGVRTCNSFWRSPELFTHNPENFERFLMGLSSQSTEREDNEIVEDLRGRVFGPMEFSRRDLMAINIQRGRDHGLPDYNTARKHFGLPTLDSLELQEYKDKTQTEVPDEIIERLAVEYDDDPNKVDIWAGGLLETRNGPGQLFSRIILDQFRRTRDADRFWFENTNNGLFTDAERQRIRKLNIIDVVLSVTTLVPGEDIQNDPFTAVHVGNDVSRTCQDQLSESRTCALPNGTSTTCRYLPQVATAEDCSLPETYDYFQGSEASYILTFTFVLAACVGLLIYVLVKARLKVRDSTKKVFGSIKVKENVHKAKEKVGRFKSRYVMVELSPSSRHINVKDVKGQLLRTIDFRNVKELVVRHLEDHTRMVISASNHYDLVLTFEDGFHGGKLFEELEKFCQDTGVPFKPRVQTKTSILLGVVTVKQREKHLAEFSRIVMESAFADSKKAKATANLLSMKSSTFDETLSLEITQVELANQLGMSPESIFMKQLFNLMDKDQNGFITIKEFWDVMVVFAQGTLDEKARLMFSIYDLSNKGYISSEDFMNIIKSTLGSEGKDRDLDQIVNTMLASVGLSHGHYIDFNQFLKIVELQGDVFKNLKIDMQQADKNTVDRRFSLYGDIPVGGFAAEAARKEYEEAKADVTEEDDTKEPLILGSLHQYYVSLVNNIRVNAVFWFWIVLYTIVMILIFVERAYYYSVEREHGGLRRIAGYGVTVTRGAASAMMFTYSSLLVTMCRNLFSSLRSTPAHRIFPFDYMINFHRYIGFWALFWTVMHVIGHAINFYHIATQTPPDLSCLFRDFFRGTHVLPKFHYWCWETVTGFTGVLLTLQTALIYVFAYFGREQFFRAFWWTHNTYPVYYILIVLHGSGRLVQPPFFHYFFLAPCILFALDKLVSLSRSKVKINIVRVTHLPSSVIHLEIQRPPNFNYQSGQWVKIASTGILKEEYHPFTLSSAPHEENLTLHIRGVGPWTRRLFKVYPNERPEQGYPQIYMDGPFGEGHQTWWDYEVVVLVGGGIGVTPFSSILKDIAHKLQHSKSLYRAKKVIFLWTTKSQKHFEWMTNILREVETSDKHNIIRNHIFITQFKSKFDLRTIMLYLAERHFQRLSGTSLFTGLRAITHFSRPNFTSIFKSIKERYPTASIVGVFTCGNRNLSQSVEQSCQTVNKDGGPILKHYYENF